jgi:alpha-L-fucosidase
MLRDIDALIARGPFSNDWDSLNSYQAPDWYVDGKFGIFIHWGVYSVPAFGTEWYPRNMYVEGSEEFKHHLATYGPHREFGYKDFIPSFKAERYEPVAWAALFRESGARFVVPVAEHHDGFPIYDTALSDWCAAKMGPQRDLIGELATAVRAEDMVFGASSHRAEHWWFFGDGMQFDSDVRDPANAGLYAPAHPKPDDHHDYSLAPPDEPFLQDWLLRTCELVDRYRPQLVWFDWWIQQEAFEPYLRRFAAYYYNRGHEWGQGVAINHKFQAFPEGAAVYDVERGQLGGIRPLFWQTDTSVSKNSWGYIENHDYKEAGDIIRDLVDIVSKNGALLLNIGPRSDGTIPDREVEMLREIGSWLRVNGEAIYGTRPWTVFGEGPTVVVEGSFADTERQAFTSADIRFTQKPGVLYATILGVPGDGRVTIRSLGTNLRLLTEEVKDVVLLGSDAPIDWSLEGDGLHLLTPDKQPSRHAIVLKIGTN